MISFSASRQQSFIKIAYHSKLKMGFYILLFKSTYHQDERSQKLAFALTSKRSAALDLFLHSKYWGLRVRFSLVIQTLES
jgi:hypothetical protein